MHYGAEMHHYFFVQINCLDSRIRLARANCARGLYQAAARAAVSRPDVVQSVVCDLMHPLLSSISIVSSISTQQLDRTRMRAQNAGGVYHS